MPRHEIKKEKGVVFYDTGGEKRTDELKKKAGGHKNCGGRFRTQVIKGGKTPGEKKPDCGSKKKKKNVDGTNIPLQQETPQKNAKIYRMKT